MHRSPGLLRLHIFLVELYLLLGLLLLVLGDLFLGEIDYKRAIGANAYFFGRVGGLVHFFWRLLQVFTHCHVRLEVLIVVLYQSMLV